MQYPSAHSPALKPAFGGLRILTLLLPLVGCGREVPVTTARFDAFGAVADLSLVRVDQRQAERAAALVKEDFARLERAWDPAQPEGLGRVNARLPAGEPFVAPPAVLPLVRMSQTLSQRSGGLFNPATGALVQLWGFRTGLAASHAPPDAQAIARLVAANPRMSDIRVADLALAGNNPALRLDFGAIAKGAAIDLGIARLRALNIRDAQIQIGGTLRAIGDRSGQPWRVALRRSGGGGVLAILDIRGDESVSTVAAYDRNFIYGGTTYHDILDPRTGWPAVGTQSVTVVGREAAAAQAAATALFVAGPEGWVAVARALGVRFALLADSRGAVRISPQLRARIQPLDPGIELIASEPLAPTPDGGSQPPSDSADR